MGRQSISINLQVKATDAEYEGRHLMPVANFPGPIPQTSWTMSLCNKFLSTFKHLQP